VLVLIASFFGVLRSSHSLPRRMAKFFTVYLGCRITTARVTWIWLPVLFAAEGSRRCSEAAQPPMERGTSGSPVGTCPVVMELAAAGAKFSAGNDSVPVWPDWIWL